MAGTPNPFANADTWLDVPPNAPAQAPAPPGAPSPPPPPRDDPQAPAERLRADRRAYRSYLDTLLADSSYLKPGGFPLGRKPLPAIRARTDALRIAWEFIALWLPRDVDDATFCAYVEGFAQVNGLGLAAAYDALRGPRWCKPLPWSVLAALRGIPDLPTPGTMTLLSSSGPPEQLRGQDALSDPAFLREIRRPC